MDKYDTSQLTEFPRFEPESTQSGVTTFFNKLWKFPIFSPNEQDDSQNRSSNGKDDAPNDDKQDYDDKTETGSYAAEMEGRSLPNVLRRISSLVALGTGSGTRYADTELARYWMPDDISRECYECATRFSTLRRRHHCRVCGQIFCSRCCSQRVPGHIFGCAGGLRVCNYCCNVVLSYLKENDLTGEISPDLRTLQENLQVKFPEHRSQQTPNKGRENFMFARDQEDRSEVRPSPKEALQDVYRQLSFTLPTQQHRYRLVRYNGVWRGCDILQWVMDNTNNKTRAQAHLVCQSLLSSGYMECMGEVPHFADYALYRPTAMPPTLAQDDDSPEECTRLVESVSSYCLDLNLGESSARLIKTPKTSKEVKSSESSDEETPALEQNEVYSEIADVCPAIVDSGEEHLRLLMRQCLARSSLPAAWLDTLYPLCHQAAEIVMPEAHSNDIDIRNYVQVKKVPGGSMRDSTVLHGVVLTKNVAHRGMPQQITNPTVLLLDCSIAYQRVEGKLTSLEPVLMQEQEYLVRCAARITALSPKVVLVRGSAARGVQDLLRDSSKTLMVLEGCAEPNLGCCILLRGGSLQELVRVKKVVKFMLLACYNWKLEKSFLGDIEAILPEPGMTFDDDDNDESKNNNSNNLVAKFNEEFGIERKKSTEINSDTKSDTTDVRSNENNKTDLFNDNSNDAIVTDKDEIKESPNNDTMNDDALFFGINNKINQKSKPDDVISTNDSLNEPINEDTKSNDSISLKGDDDPLQKSKPYIRKADSEKNFSCGVPIRDFSDPLRSTLSVDDEVFLPKDDTKLKADTHAERWSTDDAVLSMSPNVVIPAPYLETEAGRRCPLRQYFPHPLFVQQTKPPPTPRSLHRKISRPFQNDVILKEVHEFIRNPITASVDDPALKAALAHYRATGCRLLNDKHRHSCPLYKPSVIKKIIKEPETDTCEKQADEPLDPLAPENHQRLSLLLYSYSNKSANVPDFCVNPWIVSMEMYGRHDISLGGFLEKYCFNTEYKCTSNSCQVPMNQHVRRFVHGDVCVTITCNTIGHSNVDKIREEQSKQVMFWSRCEYCGVTGRARRLSRASLALSLGQYIRWRCLAARYLRASTCRHPLHRHAHAFVSNLTTAWFRYSKISTYEIKLPSDMISIKYDTKQMREALINQLNELMLKGHEGFSGVGDGEADKEYQAFKQHMDQIHLALTSTSMQEHTTLAGVVRSLWNVSDRIISGEKMLRDAQEKWATATTKQNKPQLDVNVDDKSDIEDPNENGNNDVTGTTYVFATDNTTKDNDREHAGTEEDEEKGDKKTVRQILSQLLSNNQPSHQDGMIVSSGLVPVVVRDGEVGSVIAATLASITYRRARTIQRHSTQTEQDDGESVNSTGKEKSESDKGKAAKWNEHVEVLLKDGLVCRVYYAAQFSQLRHSLLSPLTTSDAQTTDGDNKCTCEDVKGDKGLCEIEEGFIRSLAHCVPWAARGGKSGSTFCKTKDDRYVLKEMTKPEWQQFLEFAPHYFNYVNSCRQSNLPSLLARILGVYSVGGAGNGVLVMENVWYSCAGAGKRFDLKGSSRHRLASDTQPLAVLMDENLLHLRWEQQLYVHSHTGSVLWACVERDTQFLATHSVMDYSLLLGIDENTLVLGIIDYIRTFTWDKKLEHLVKKNLGSGQPTVVSPLEYKRRFCAAARKYFLQCPAHWDHLYATTHA
ncbi:hypothetical protein K1T71_005914 [Dendrolimus kikuchii]|uniref:Uncharacterized protein n=1 Tax=Dendrolimus kikuchii TaxID=765133 RepID=A0ACC1D2L7_9NEOP|nr:hypothetical protein K1T71_005914 [Dendrolimus kikuchii]